MVRKGYSRFFTGALFALSVECGVSRKLTTLVTLLHSVVLWCELAFLLQLLQQLLSWADPGVALDLHEEARYSRLHGNACTDCCMVAPLGLLRLRSLTFACWLAPGRVAAAPCQHIMFDIVPQWQ